MSKIKPYNTETSKEKEIEEMFDNISSKYDILNRILSLGIDQSWRKKALSYIPNPKSTHLLDVATGTADIAILAAEKYDVPQVVGFDLSANMLEIAQKKIAKRKLEDIISLKKGTSEKLPYEDNTFDAITVGFGVRNFDNLENGLDEMYRVLKPGGKCIILEFSHPRSFPFKNLYNFYGKNVLPLLGRITSGDNKAYTYLFESSMKFPAFEKFTSILDKRNFKDTSYKSMTLGICCIYTGTK